MTAATGAPAAELPLRVLHVISSMAPEAGGPPMVCAGLAEALAANGHSVTIAGIQTPACISLPPTVHFVSFPSDGGARYSHSNALGKWLDEHVAEFDIVHLHSVWQFPTFAAARACWREKKPYVVLLNGMLDQYVVNRRSYWIKRGYWFFREGRVERRANGIHFLNRAEIRRAVRWVQNIPKFVIANGISQSELAHLPAQGRFRAAHPEIGERPLALFLSRIHPKKGLDRLIPAWKLLAEKRPDLRLVIAGSGDADYVVSIDQVIAQHNLQQQVIRVGQLVGEKKWEALVDADVFVLPSHQEGFSMAITEALAAGTPPVITEECNFDELAEYQCGEIIRGGDMDAFTHAVEKLLDDPTRREAMGAAGRAIVLGQFTWEKIAVDLEKVYRHILAGRPLPADGQPVWR